MSDYQHIEINTNSTKTDNEDEVNEIAQTIVYVIIFILLIFMGMFIYNLVKCYLPVWLNKNKSKKNNPYNMNNSKNQPHYDLADIGDSTI